MGILDKWNIGYESIDDLIQAEFEEAKTTEEDGKLKIEIKNPGAFTKWCEEHKALEKDENGKIKVGCKCIAKALREAFRNGDTKLERRALFAYNFGYKKNGKTCEEVEEILNKHKKKK